MSKHPNTLLLLGVTIALVVAALLVGRLFNASWAGGEGYKAQARAMLIQVKNDQEVDCPLPNTIKRGQHLKTCVGVYAEYAIGDTRILLDENTNLVLSDARAVPTFSFITGRVVTRGPSIFTVRDTLIESPGSATYVHYSWKNRVDTRALEGQITITQEPKQHAIAQGNAATIDTLAPIDEPAETLFDITAENLQPFYNWALPVPN